LMAPQMIGSSIMFGIEKHKYLLYMIIAEGIFNVILSVIFVNLYGLIGIAYGTIIPQIFIYLFVVPKIIDSIVKLEIIRFHFRHLFYSILGFGLTFLVSKVIYGFISPKNWTGLTIEVSIVVTITFLIGYRIFGKDITKMLFSRMKNV